MNHADNAIIPYQTIKVPGGVAKQIFGPQAADGSPLGGWVGDFTNLHIYVEPGVDMLLLVSWRDNAAIGQGAGEIETFDIGGFAGFVRVNLPIVTPYVAIFLFANVSGNALVVARLTNHDGLPVTQGPGVGAFGPGPGLVPAAGNGVVVGAGATTRFETLWTFAGRAHLWVYFTVAGVLASLAAYDYTDTMLGYIAQVSTVGNNNIDVALPANRVRLHIFNSAGAAQPVYASLIPY